LILELRKTISGQVFLIKEIYNDKNRIIIFTTVQNCSYLRESEFWLADLLIEENIRYVYL